MALSAVSDRPSETTSATLGARVRDATVRCVSRWGVAKTTVDDVAREAGCSRASIYRAFPGGKEALLHDAARAEIARFAGYVAAALDGEDDLEDRLVAGITGATRFIADHEALQFLLAHEPEAVLRHLAFQRLDGLFADIGRLAAPYLGRHLPSEEADRVAEWAARVVLSYTLNPSASLDLRDPADARRLVGTYLLPGLSISPTKSTPSTQSTQSVAQGS